jgi:hypothetical protein
VKQPRFSYRPIQRPATPKFTQLALPFSALPKRRLELAHLRNAPIAPPLAGSSEAFILADINEFAPPRNTR